MYNLAVIDPPWPKRKGGLREVRPNQGRTLSYPTMELPAIWALLDKEIFSLMNRPHNIFLWVIDTTLIPAEEAMLSRGYRRHCRFIWDKQNGVAPAFTVRYSHEYLIWYYKPKLPIIDWRMQGKLMTVFSEKARQHSRKPDISYEMLEALYPTATKIDVFSREPRPGWAQWGNEQDFFAGASNAT